MENLQIFEDSAFGRMRVLEKDGEPWFVGKDVAVALGYVKPADAIRVHVDDDDKGVCETKTPGGMQNVTIINESGLYSLVLSSKLESAKAFKRWVTSEILPAVRKHGGYLTPEKTEEFLLNPDTIIKLATSLKEEREKRQELEALRAADRPKVIFADSVSASDTDILIGDLAKILTQNGLNIGQNRLFEKLREDGYLCKRKGDMWNSPTQDAMELGLFKIKETVINTNGRSFITKTVKVTGRGQTYFVDRFLNK